MEIIQIKIEQIQPNPFQPRESEDSAHIQKLAVSIAEQGLLQIPLARVLSEETDLNQHFQRFELAFGHSRLAAFKYLSAFNPIYNTMPLIVREITDEEMFRLAISENLARKDLTPIEEAKAMLVYRDHFSKTSVEIGKLFGLSDSAVRNKMRLLSLPDGIKNSLRAGEITEGMARALIPLYDIPTAQRLAAEDQDGEIKPSEILDLARSGVSPDKVSELIVRLVKRMARLYAETAQYPLITDAITEPNPAAAITLAPEPEPIPAPEQNVSTETVDDIEEESEEEDAQIPETHIVAPAIQTKTQERPVSETIATTFTNRPSAVFKTPEPTPSQAKPETVAVPAPTLAEKILAPSWERSTILLSLTLWPEDGSLSGRVVSIGGRVNQGAPAMTMVRESDLALPKQLLDVLDGLKMQLQLGGSK